MFFRKPEIILTLLKACKHAPAAGAAPREDSLSECLREFSENWNNLNHNTPRHQTGDWWRKRGGIISLEKPGHNNEKYGLPLN